MDRICYAYMPFTGEYVAPLEADVSPLEEGVLLYPAHTTLTPPPEAPEGEVPVWTGEAWELKPDHRGEQWFSRYGEIVIVDRAGDPTTFSPPLTKTAPPPATPQPSVPTECTKLGLKRAFGDRWPQVRAFIESDEDRAEEWQLAVTVRRTDPLVTAAIAYFSMTPEEVDALLVAAVAAVS